MANWAECPRAVSQATQTDEVDQECILRAEGIVDVLAPSLPEHIDDCPSTLFVPQVMASRKNEQLIPQECISRVEEIVGAPVHGFLEQSVGESVPQVVEAIEVERCFPRHTSRTGGRGRSRTEGLGADGRRDSAGRDRCKVIPLERTVRAEEIVDARITDISLSDLRAQDNSGCYRIFGPSRCKLF